MRRLRSAMIGGASASALLIGAGSTAAQERASVAGTVDAIVAGETSADAAVQDALAAFEAWSELNAVAVLDGERALERAQAVDAGEVSGPLAGLPIVVKDNTQVEGLPASAGTPALRSVFSEESAPIVERLTLAGAIVVATSNMHELAFGISGWNPVYQTGSEPGVRNPYDTSRFAGGSSSGTGALVGAGAVLAGLGTDTGGSVRVPAAINGAAGLRPTMERYPAEGIVPISSTRDTPGFIAATVADIELLDRVVTGDDEARAADLDGLRLGIAPGFTADLDGDVQAVWDDTIARLEEAGVEMVDVDASSIFELNATLSFPIAFYEGRRDLVAYLEAYAPELTIEDVVSDIASPDVKGTYEMIVLPGQLPMPDGTMAELGPIYETAISEGRPALIAEYESLFDEGGIDALIFPTVPQVAGMAGPEASSPEMFNRIIRNTDPGSNAGLPGLSVPAALGTETGLPVGIELDGPAGSDRRLIEIGLAIEDVLGPLPRPDAP
ncbi:indoleacetamide hydrolase [Roseicyclus sp. F158]|uniref:Indoleacetamide hydrolase n=1 Tax=Tropicimonas omnivorans TaxID=3075590 RepID=A0ABU3DEP4_9RHOB|nr:indoleacetamide hydrolase [Roseicyclus sp. F158]MDT0682192.1 indoleacetamide hydrolase [Roseicyclus sp. F158]